MKRTYRTIFISDVHLGTKDSQADLLNNFLKHNSCEKLYLVEHHDGRWEVVTWEVVKNESKEHSKRDVPSNSSQGQAS